MYKVTVGNIGEVHKTSPADKKTPDEILAEAVGVYELYMLRSIRNQGAGAQEDVTLWRDDEPLREHCGAMPRAIDVLRVLPDTWLWDGDHSVMLPAGVSLHWHVVDGDWCEYRAFGDGRSCVGSDPEQAITRLKSALRNAAARLNDLAGAL